MYRCSYEIEIEKETKKLPGDRVSTDKESERSLHLLHRRHHPEHEGNPDSLDESDDEIQL